MKRLVTWIRCIALLMLLSLASGCASAVAAGSNTLLSGDDLQEMTDRMARSMLADADVQAAIQREGALPVVMQPVQNYMTGVVLPRGQSLAFIARLRALLADAAPHAFVWVMNRDAFYELRASETTYDLGPAPERIQPRYSLTARFDSLANVSRDHRSDSYLCAFQLADLQTGEILWNDRYEVKKSTVRGFLD